MNTIKQAELINALQNQVEEHIQLAVSVFQNLSTAQLQKQPSKEKWSIAQCLWHLNSYGDFYLPLIAKKAGHLSNKSSFTSGWFGNYFIKMMHPASGKKYKAFKAHVPPNEPDARETVTKFISQQEQMMFLLKQTYHSNLDARMPISISALVKLKLGDVLQFIIMHNERHIQQAKTILKLIMEDSIPKAHQKNKQE